MINIKNKKCVYKNCKKSQIYNIKGHPALYCSKHKLDGMINIVSLRCNENNCDLIPSYNIEGCKPGIYCFKHKKEEMINVISKICIEVNCKKHPNYNIEGNKSGIYCFNHKKEGMVDVKHPKCNEINCKTRPQFNIKGEKRALYCFTHKKEEMVDITHKKCIHINCTIRAIFNMEGYKVGLYCFKHKLDGMINIKDKNCKNSWCYTIIHNNKYDGYCLRCFIYLFPDKPVTRNYKTKEYAVVEFVKNKFPQLNWIADKIINGGCSKKRPDLLLDLLYQIIIVEIDENQHIDYDCSCENKRIMELSQDLGHRPIIFIRFNPDDYEDNGKNITSCWGQNKNGICVIKKTKNDEWTNRLTILENQINYWIQNTTNKTVEIIQLFYDR